MIDRLLEFVDSAPRPVAAGLLAVIVVGGVGGGFVISSLRSSIEAKNFFISHQKSLLDRKEEITELRFESQIQDLRRENVILRKQVELLSEGLETTRNALDEIRETLAIQDTDDTPIQDIARIVTSADERVKELDRTLRTARDISGFGSRVAGLEPPPIDTTLPPSMSSPFAGWLLLLILLACLVIMIALIVRSMKWIWHKVRRQ